jgi:SAM-dependent methyltransferase
LIVPEPIDWAQRWLGMVEARAEQVMRLRGERAGEAYWDRRAATMRRLHGVVPPDNPVMRVMEPWLNENATVLDVGAGAGRFAIAFAPLVKGVSAIEPSSAMVDFLLKSAAERNIDNIRVTQTTWENAPDESADVVFSAHVLYPIPDVVPFILKLHRAARRVCVLVLRGSGSEALLRQPWIALHGEEPRGDPAFIEAYNLLWSLGIATNVHMIPPADPMEFSNRQDALAWSRDMLWLPDRVSDEDLWARLEPLLVRSEAGLTMREAPAPTAVVWWQTA